jgi:ribosome-associated protein
MSAARTVIFERSVKKMAGAIRIPEGELRWTFVRAGGPGGQNVNKVASKAVLRWNVLASPSLPAEVKDRLQSQQSGRITTEGDLIITSQRFRDQERNRLDCLAKLGAAVTQASVRPKPRKPTRPTRGSREARLVAKRRRSSIKSKRRRPVEE